MVKNAPVHCKVCEPPTAVDKSQQLSHKLLDSRNQQSFLSTVASYGKHTNPDESKFAANAQALIDKLSSTVALDFISLLGKICSTWGPVSNSVQTSLKLLQRIVFSLSSSFPLRQGTARKNGSARLLVPMVPPMKWAVEKPHLLSTR